MESKRRVVIPILESKSHIAQLKCNVTLYFAVNAKRLTTCFLSIHSPFNAHHEIIHNALLYIYMMLKSKIKCQKWSTRKTSCVLVWMICFYRSEALFHHTKVIKLDHVLIELQVNPSGHLSLTKSTPTQFFWNPTRDRS